MFVATTEMSMRCDATRRDEARDGAITSESESVTGLASLPRPDGPPPIIASE